MADTRAHGREGREQLTTGSATNFETDPIHVVVQDGWVHAESTTLGADDGIGLPSSWRCWAKGVVRGPLEELFTVKRGGRLRRH